MQIKWACILAPYSMYVHHPIFMGYSKIFSYSCMGIEEVYFNLHHPKKTWNRTLELLDLEDEWQGAHCDKNFKFLRKIFHNDTQQIREAKWLYAIWGYSSGNLESHQYLTNVLTLSYPQSRPNHTSYRKLYFTEFVQNSLSFNMGIIFFDLRPHGGC